MLISCGGSGSGASNPETIVTQESDSLFVVESKNGLKSYMFKTPKRLSYDLAREPYEIYPEGVFVERFRDSTEEVQSTLMADFAINYKKGNQSRLWEARGNVVGHNVPEERTLRTEQLFWDEKIGRNVDCRIEQEDGVYIGEGLESDQALKYWTFRNTVSRFAVDPPAGRDSSSGEKPTVGVPEDGADAATPSGDVRTEQGAVQQNGSEQSSTEQPAPAQNRSLLRGSERNSSGQSISDRRERRRTIQPVEGEGSTFKADTTR